MAVPPTPPSRRCAGSCAPVRADYVAALDDAARSRLETALVAVLDRHLPAGVVAAYHAVGDEIDPGGLERALALPRVVRGAPLTFHRAPRAACRPGALGIPEPDAAAPPVTPDIVLVPLLGVDRGGTRLGQGAGYYDRTLAALRATRPVLAVGVAWDCQRVDPLPADPWDAPLDALATPSGWYRFACRSG